MRRLRVIDALKTWVKRRWPALRLRTILFSVLLFTAALPGVSAIFLRVYENTLVRQTEAELIAQGAALSAAAAAAWPGEAGRPAPRLRPEDYRPEQPGLDLSTDEALPERPAGQVASGPPAPDAVMTAQALEPVIAGTARTTLASVVLTDARGVVVRGGEPGKSYAALPEVAAALAGRPATVLRENGDYAPRYRFEWLSRASNLRIHHARPVVVQGRVVGVVLLSRSSRALFRGLYQDLGKISLGIAAIFGLLVVMSGVVSRGVTRPIEALSSASRAMAAGSAAPPPPTPELAAVEIRTLYDDFRAMAEAIERRSRYLSDFAAAVSHEFKTPLAGIRGGVELLEDHLAEMDEADRRRFLANISADTDRLSQLVTRLLDLARADMIQPGPNAVAEVASAVRRIADAHAAPGFAVEVELADDLPARAAAPETTLDAVLNALVENARQAGARQVRIAGRRSGRRELTLSVIDNGPGVPPGDRDRLFEPFFTSRRTKGGTGLGLPIARSLLAASHGRVDYVKTDIGARFDVSLPAAEERGG